MKRIVPLIISALMLTALCACGKDEPESPADIKTDQITSESTDSEKNAAENLPSATAETTADTVGQLVITPADASVSPLEMRGDELTDLFVNRIFANYTEWNNIADNGTALTLDFNDEYDDGNDATQYYLVLNIQDYAAFQELTDAVFSRGFQENVLFPQYIDQICPLFVSHNNRLYYNYNTGGCVEFIIDPASAEITDRTDDSFSVSVGVNTHEVSETFVYRIVRQDGHWVMDNDYWYKDTRSDAEKYTGADYLSNTAMAFWDNDVINKMSDAEIRKFIDAQLKTLTKDSYSLHTEKEIIAAHPDAFDKIIHLGKKALSSLNEIVSDSQSVYESRCLAKYAAYTIDPSPYDLVFESPDGKSSLKLSVSSFMGDWLNNKLTTTYGKLTLNKIANPDTELAVVDCTDAEVSWSDGGNYAVLIGKRTDDRFPSSASLIETLTGKLTTLPSLEIYNEILKKEPELEAFLSFSVEGCEWNSGEPTIVFELETGAAFYPRAIKGQYTFDTKARELKNITYDPIVFRTPGEALSDEEIRQIVDENLDILTKDSELWDSDKELIAAHPEAFEKIIALGESAVEYLEEIGNGYKQDAVPENNRCFIAKAAEYIIDPDLYDLTFASPDGRYELKANVYSFDGLNNMFVGMEYKLCVVESGTNAVLAAAPSFFLSSPDFRVNWTPDSRYVTIEQVGKYNYKYTSGFSAENWNYFVLPDTVDLENLLGCGLSAYAPESEYGLNDTDFSFKTESDGILKVSLRLSDMSGAYIDAGWYLFDTVKEEVIEARFEFPRFQKELTGYSDNILRYTRPSASVDISASYPALNGSDPVTGSINKQIYDFVMSEYKERIESDTDAAMYGMISKMRYEITRMDDELLSIHFSASFSGSGSPQYVNDYEMTFDMKTGERVAPESLSD